MVSLNLSVTEEMRPTLNQLPVEALMLEKFLSGRQSLIINWVRGYVEHALKTQSAIKISDESIVGVTARITRLVLCTLRYETSLLEGSADEIPDAQKLNEEISARAKKQTDLWVGNQKGSDFCPEKQDPNFIECLKLYEGQIPNELQKHLKAADVGFRRGRWENFDEVRSGSFQSVDRTNVHDFLPEIQASYEKHQFDMGILRKYLRNEPEGATEFHRHAHNGRIFPDFEESVNGAMSVREKMIHDFTVEGSSYRGKCLLDSKGKIQSWSTYWQTPDENFVRSFLKKGMTNGYMQYQYQSKECRKLWLNQRKRIQIFDTIIGNVPMASARLIAHATNDMLREDPKPEYLIAFRQNDLFIDPSPEHIKSPLPIARNSRSERFFNERECEYFATGYNPDGPWYPRKISEDSVVRLNAAWGYFAAPMQDMHIASWRLWRNIQDAYGDISPDDCNVDLLKQFHRYTDSSNLNVLSAS